VDRDLNPALLRSMTRRYVVGMSLYILAFVNVVVTLLLIVGLVLLFVLPEPGERPRKTPGSSEDTITEDGGADREAG
jgi:hypothetical protein